jgi:hypothetical protein
MKKKYRNLRPPKAELDRIIADKNSDPSLKALAQQMKKDFMYKEGFAEFYSNLYSKIIEKTKQSLNEGTDEAYRKLRKTTRKEKADLKR